MAKTKPLAQGRHRTLINFYMICSQKMISRRKKIAKEGSNWGPCCHEATVLPFALQHLRGEVDSSIRLLYGIPSGIHGLRRVYV